MLETTKYFIMCEKITIMYPSSGLLPSNKKEQIMMHATTWISFRGIVLGERRWSRETAHYVVHLCDILEYEASS
jgi:hypothetical protein